MGSTGRARAGAFGADLRAHTARGGFELIRGELNRRFDFLAGGLLGVGIRFFHPRFSSAEMRRQSASTVGYHGRDDLPDRRAVQRCDHITALDGIDPGDTACMLWPVRQVAARQQA